MFFVYACYFRGYAFMKWIHRAHPNGTLSLAFSHTLSFMLDLTAA